MITFIIVTKNVIMFCFQEYLNIIRFYIWENLNFMVFHLSCDALEYASI